MFEKLLQDLQAVLKEMAEMLNVKKGLQEEINRLEQENAGLKEEINKHVCETPKCDHTDYEQKIAQLTEQVETMQKEISSLEEEKANHVCPDHAEEIQALEKQAHEIRKKNSKEFERILNKKQKAELETMKAEGRARFEKYHKARTPFQGLGTPNMFLKPLLPPPPQKEGLWK